MERDEEREREGGCDIAATDVEGNTALHLAYATGASACVSFLENICSNNNNNNTRYMTRDDEDVGNDRNRVDIRSVVNMRGKLPLECAGSYLQYLPVFPSYY